MSIVAIIIIAIALVFTTARLYLQHQFEKGVYQLFSLGNYNQKKQFSYSHFANLPPPVQRYLRFALKEGQPPIHTVRLLHNGWFKTAPDKKWMKIKGEQYFTTAVPGFVWKGKTSMFTAIDKFVKDQGRLTVKLLSLFTIVESEGVETSYAELQRWLAESVWFPCNFLPNEHLAWEPINENAAKLLFTYKDIHTFYIVSFNEKGEIVQLTTRRYMNKDRIETWTGKCSDYKELDNLHIPTTIEAIWELEDGPYSYAKFHVQKIEYNISIPF